MEQDIEIIEDTSKKINFNFKSYFTLTIIVGAIIISVVIPMFDMYTSLTLGLLVKIFLLFIIGIILVTLLITLLIYCF